MKEHQSQSTENDIIADDQNYIFKAWKDLKDSIFNVLYVLLDSKQEQEQQQPMFGLIFQSGFDYLQMLAFPFNSFIISSWNGGETLTNVFQLFNKFNVVSYMPGVGFNTFLILLYALIVLIILVLIDIIYVSYSFSKKKFKFTWPLVILAKLVPLFVTIFFLPITQTLLSVVSCQQDSTNSYQVMSSFPQVVCWKGWHLFHAAITLLFVALFVFISSVVALALFEPRMTSNKITARQNSTGQVIFIFNKIICQLIFSFTPFDQLWVYSVMLFLLSGWLYWTYNMNDPFYDKRASKFFRILSSYYFWTNFMLLVSQLLSPLGFDGGLVIWISGLPFIGIIIGFEHKSNIDQLFSFNLKFKSGEQLQNHLRYVLQLLQSQQQDKNSYMLITGYIQKHKQICVEDDCPLKITKKINKSLTDKEDLNQKFLLQIQRMYKTGIKKYPGCTRLRLSFAFFQLERLKNKNKAYQQFSYALKTNPTFEQQFIVYRFKKIIKQNLQEDDETQQNKTDLIEIIRFQNHISLCEQAMIRSARLHKDFWTELKEQTPDLKKLNQLGSKITMTINVVKQNYQQIQKINNSVLQVLYCYSLYLLMVTKDNLEGKKLLEMSKKLYLQKMNDNYKKQVEQQCSLSEIQTANLPMVCVSSKLTSVGKILNVNSLFSQLSGYQKQQIVQRNIQKILSDIYKDVHEQKIKNWLQSEEQTTYINKPNAGYLKLKSGFIMPVQYQVYYKSASESFIVTFQNNSTLRNCCHIVLDQNKIIKECSILGHAYFGLDRRLINDNDICIQDFLGIKNLQELCKKYPNQKAFQHKIYYEDQQILCEMIISEISIKLQQINQQNNNQDNEQDEMILVVKKIIGYYVKIRVMSNEKIQLLKQLKKKEQSFEKQNQSMSEGVMELYEQPNLFDILITTLAETKTKNNAQNRFQLKYKIKTMRLLNNEIKMVYDQNGNMDFDKNDHGDLEDDDLQMLKLNDDRYHQKIREAINTKLNHQQISKLTYLGVIFIGIIFAITIAQMLVCLQIFTIFTSSAETILNVTNETNSLSKYIVASLDNTTNHEAMASQIATHNVTVDAPLLNVALSRGNNSTQQVNIRDAFLYFYSRLAQFFLLKGNLNIQNIYGAYLQYIYPAVSQLSQYSKSSVPNMQIIFMMVLFCIAFVVSFTYLILWIYIRLKIDKKKSTILLWFLDIPISYVAFLGENCDNYLKNFISIKQTMEKGIKVQEQLQLEDYKEVKGKQEEIQQQQKARKTLLMKQRKLTFLSRLKVKHLKMGWIIIFGLFYSIVTMSQILALKDYENLLLSQRLFSSRSVIWANSIHLSMYMHDSGREYVNGIYMEDFQHQNMEKFENTLTQPQLSNFISDILSQDNNANYKQIVSSYIGVYAADLCLYLNQSSSSDCNKITSSSLKGGYRVFSMFIRSSGHDSKEQLRKANEEYGAQSLISMLYTWKNVINAQVQKANGLVSILFFVYIFAGLLLFFVVWMLYLSSVNTQINEAIRMLNMIPFKLLSSSRKQTRSFISWIIKQANKKNHQF